MQATRPLQRLFLGGASVLGSGRQVGDLKRWAQAPSTLNFSEPSTLLDSGIPDEFGGK